MPETTYHYHTTLTCEHKVSFDSPTDFDAELDKQGGDEAVVVLPCGQCGGVERESVELIFIGFATQDCECKQ